ncbi:MAG: fatty acid desaturase [Pseudomonadota bacterium]
MQHECVHGHPFCNSRLNDAIVLPPLGLFIPYLRFKAVHLEHHMNARICDPYDDPESWYVAQDFWERLPRSVKLVFEANNTLIGRLLLGPAISLIRLAISDGQAIRAGDRSVLQAWLLHIVLLVPVLVVVFLWSGLLLPVYFASAYAGMSLLMVRTYLEHQAEESVRGRSVIIEDRGPFSFLFLNNNLHAVHHAYPAVAWHQLPSLYRRNRERFLAMNKGYFFRSYGEIFRLFAFRRKEPVVHPLSGGKGL